MDALLPFVILALLSLAVKGEGRGGVGGAELAGFGDPYRVTECLESVGNVRNGLSDINNLRKDAS